jgi:hypothetical protein
MGHEAGTINPAVTDRRYRIVHCFLLQDTRTVGMNNLGAASHAQQKADEHVRQNLRQMIKRIESVAAQHGFGRLIFAGSSEITANLEALLPKRLASRVIGTMTVATNANLEEIRNAAAPIVGSISGHNFD